MPQNVLLNAEFRSCSSRCLSLLWAYIGRSCSASWQGLPPCRRCQVAGRAVACHRACSSVANEFANETLCTTLCYGWRLRLRCTYDTRGVARLVRFLAEEKGEHVRFDWTGEEPPSNIVQPLHHLLWSWIGPRCFRTDSSRNKQINRQSLICLLRRVTRERVTATAPWYLLLGAVSKGRSSSRKVNFVLRKLGFCCFAFDITLEAVWVPTWANQADVPSRNKPIESWSATLPILPPPPSRVFASTHALSDRICSVSRCRRRPKQWENMCKGLNPPVPWPVWKLIRCSVGGPTKVKQSTRLQICGCCLVRSSQTTGGTRIGPTHRAGLATIPSSLLQVGSLRRLVSLPTGSRPDHWRLELLFERHPGPKRALPPRRRDVLVQDVLLTSAQRYDVAVSVCENMCESRDMHGLEELVNHGLNELVLIASNIFESVLRQGVSDQDKRALSSLAWGATCSWRDLVVLIWKTTRVCFARCGVCIEWSLAIPAEFRTPVSHEIVLSAAMFAWLHNVPELSLLTLLSFHCLFRPAEARQLRWCDVKIVDGSLSTRYEKFMTSCTSENPKRAEWQAVQLSNTCFWNVLVNTMKSSIPDHGLQTGIKKRGKRKKEKGKRKIEKKGKKEKKKKGKKRKKGKRKKEKTQKKDITLPRHTHKEFSDIRVVSPVSLPTITGIHKTTIAPHTPVIQLTAQYNNLYFLLRDPKWQWSARFWICCCSFFCEVFVDESW